MNFATGAQYVNGTSPNLAPNTTYTFRATFAISEGSVTVAVYADANADTPLVPAITATIGSMLSVVLVTDAVTVG